MLETLCSLVLSGKFFSTCERFLFLLSYFFLFIRLVLWHLHVRRGVFFLVVSWMIGNNSLCISFWKVASISTFSFRETRLVVILKGSIWCFITWSQTSVVC